MPSVRKARGGARSGAHGPTLAAGGPVSATAAMRPRSRGGAPAAQLLEFPCTPTPVPQRVAHQQRRSQAGYRPRIVELDPSTDRTIHPTPAMQPFDRRSSVQSRISMTSSVMSFSPGHVVTSTRLETPGPAARDRHGSGPFARPRTPKTRSMGHAASPAPPATARQQPADDAAPASPAAGAWITPVSRRLTSSASSGGVRSPSASPETPLVRKTKQPTSAKSRGRPPPAASVAQHGTSQSQSRASGGAAGAPARGTSRSRSRASSSAGQDGSRSSPASAIQSQSAASGTRLGKGTRGSPPARAVPKSAASLKRSQRRSAGRPASSSPIRRSVATGRSRSPLKHRSASTRGTQGLAEDGAEEHADSDAEEQEVDVTGWFDGNVDENANAPKAGHASADRALTVIGTDDDDEDDPVEDEEAAAAAEGNNDDGAGGDVADQDAAADDDEDDGADDVDVDDNDKPVSSEHFSRRVSRPGSWASSGPRVNRVGASRSATRVSPASRDGSFRASDRHASRGGRPSAASGGGASRGGRPVTSPSQRASRVGRPSTSSSQRASRGGRPSAASGGQASRGEQPSTSPSQRVSRGGRPSTSSSQRVSRGGRPSSGRAAARLTVSGASQPSPGSARRTSKRAPGSASAGRVSD
ncbi:mucin-19-like [Pollicipes pollicipes]|uniref:mucin-19-like n=1 Tax=Pollicipes pollicipes TaxID=41117 RepID=UPI00188505C3|nr:mucin-19-like [Pollicipes pollicipes]